MAFKVDFSSSLAAAAPPAAPNKTKFHIAGSKYRALHAPLKMCL
jgi:hypothetical protein